MQGGSSKCAREIEPDVNFAPAKSSSIDGLFRLKSAFARRDRHQEDVPFLELAVRGLVGEREPVRVLFEFVFVKLERICQLRGILVVASG